MHNVYLNELFISCSFSILLYKENSLAKAGADPRGGAKVYSDIGQEKKR